MHEEETDRYPACFLPAGCRRRRPFAVQWRHAHFFLRGIALYVDINITYFKFNLFNSHIFSPFKLGSISSLVIRFGFLQYALILLGRVFRFLVGKLAQVISVFAYYNHYSTPFSSLQPFPRDFLSLYIILISVSLSCSIFSLLTFSLLYDIIY